MAAEVAGTLGAEEKAGEVVGALEAAGVKEVEAAGAGVVGPP
jgi:hypothetical protein